MPTARHLAENVGLVLLARALTVVGVPLAVAALTWLVSTVQGLERTMVGIDTRITHGLEWRVADLSQRVQSLEGKR